MKCTAAKGALLLMMALPCLARAQEPAQPTPPTQPAPTAPPADAHETARGFAEEAFKLYEAGRYELALELFQKADGLYPAPSFRAYIGRIYGRLGKLRKSLASYDLALQMPRPAKPSPTFVEGQTAAAAERPEIQKRVPTVRIEVTGAAAQDVTVTVDEEPVGAPERLRLELDPGTHVIAASAPGMRARLETVVLKEGASLDVRLKLDPLQDEAAKADSWKPLAITGGAVGGAGLVVAIVTGAVLAQKHSTIESQCPHNVCTATGWSAVGTVAPLNAANLASWVVVAAGGTAAIVFACLSARKGPTRAPATAIVPAPLDRGGGMWLTRSF